MNLTFAAQLPRFGQANRPAFAGNKPTGLSRFSGADSFQATAPIRFGQADAVSGQEPSVKVQLDKAIADMVKTEGSLSSTEGYALRELIEKRMDEIESSVTTSDGVPAKGFSALAEEWGQIPDGPEKDAFREKVRRFMTEGFELLNGLPANNPEYKLLEDLRVEYEKTSYLMSDDETFRPAFLRLKEELTGKPQTREERYELFLWDRAAERYKNSPVDRPDSDIKRLSGRHIRWAANPDAAIPLKESARVLWYLQPRNIYDAFDLAYEKIKRSDFKSADLTESEGEGFMAYILTRFMTKEAIQEIAPYHNPVDGFKSLQDTALRFPFIGGDNADLLGYYSHKQKKYVGPLADFPDVVRVARDVIRKPWGDKEVSLTDEQKQKFDAFLKLCSAMTSADNTTLDLPESEEPPSLRELVLANLKEAKRNAAYGEGSQYGRKGIQDVQNLCEAWKTLKGEDLPE